MDRWKAELGRVREKRRVEERRAEERRSEKRKNQKREDAGAWKGRKVAIHCVAAEGRKVGSLKRRVRSHVVRWEMKSCTQLWPEADFQVKMYKAHHVRTTFGSWDIEKVHGVVAQSTCPSQNVQSTPCSVHVEKCTPLWREAHFEVKTYKTPHVRTTFGRSDVILRGVQGIVCAPCQKWAKLEGFVAVSKTMAGVRHLKRICKDAFRVAGAMPETCSSEMLGGQGADYLRWVAFWSIRSSVLGSWFCVTSSALRMTRLHFFVAVAIL